MADGKNNHNLTSITHLISEFNLILQTSPLTRPPNPDAKKNIMQIRREANRKPGGQFYPPPDAAPALRMPSRAHFLLDMA